MRQGKKAKISGFVLAFLMLPMLAPNATTALSLYTNTNTSVNAVIASYMLGTNANTSADIDVTAELLNDDAAKVNAATSEKTQTVQGNGTLIEIGNTTAANTTIIIRTQSPEGTTEDRTFVINNSTKIVGETGLQTSLSDWIAGDPIQFTAQSYTNSDDWVAIKLQNMAFKSFNRGVNGWITAIHTDTNKIDVFWNGQTYVLAVADAKIVAGVINPAVIGDLRIGDRVRARVTDDTDTSRLTWNASIVVVLRRGNALFMRITRWVIPATITKIPTDLTLPVTIEASVDASPFYEKNDVNNLIGAPGTKIMVDITENTKLVRRYYGKALLGELSEGDSIRIIGRRDEATGHIVANVVKDNSIQRLGVAHRLAKVDSIDASAKTLVVTLFKTDNTDKTWTIKTTNSTKVYVDGTLGSWSDVKVGSTVRIRGTANRTTMSITADTIVIVSA